MSEPVLTARGLGARAGEHVLLDGIDVDLTAGHVIAVVGRSGSGKTTLGSALQGESGSGVALTGSVELHGTELLGRTDARRRRTRAGKISSLPQHPAAVLNPVRRVGKVLRELAKLRYGSRTEQDSAVAEALRSAQLVPDGDLLRRFPHQLSGGQQQRVALAQALITRPEVVVLDEPTTGLDTTTKAETADMLADLVSAGTALVLLTHDLPLARRLAHEVLVLHDGRVVEHGPGTRPLHAPAHEHTRAVLAAEPRLETYSDDHSDLPDVVLHTHQLGRTAKNGTRLLGDIDLTARAGRCAVIVGRSGAGKTTLGRCLAGISRPHTGRIVLDGVELAATARERSREQRRRIQYVHQDARASFDPRRPVTEQVARTAELLLASTRAEARRDAAGMLAALGLRTEQTDRLPHELSGGQLQRAALARALLARPAVLICDEITSALDVVHQAELLDALAAMKTTTDLSVVLISHDLAAVAALADEVHLLDDGHLVESASPGRLLAAPRSRAAATLVTAARAHESTGRSVDPSVD
ncbi:ABC transporter ATP-binding protein [Parasphingorhabdus pacifica]